jgi:Trypsin-like peptidase domain
MRFDETCSQSGGLRLGSGLFAVNATWPIATLVSDRNVPCHCRAYLSIFCLWAVGLSTPGGSTEFARQPPAPSGTTSAPESQEPAGKRKPSPEESLQLEKVSRAMKPAVVRLAFPLEAGKGYWGAGTGFVISREHRLVATAAHVADRVSNGRQGIARVDGTEHAYDVQRVWYHSGLQRIFDEYLFVRSADPRDGRVDTSSPDVAVLQLSSGGPELRAEFELAGDEEVARLEGRPVGILGYPISLGRSWPAINEAPPAAFAASAIGEMADADIEGRHAAGPPPTRQYLWFDSFIRVGGSGSPMFLSNGRVVGMLTGTTLPQLPGRNYPDVGFRIDCLRELLAYHKLDNRTSHERAIADGARAWGADPNLDRIRGAVQLGREADVLRISKKFDLALAKSNQAIALMPDYEAALLRRGKVYLSQLEDQW